MNAASLRRFASVIDIGLVGVMVLAAESFATNFAVGPGMSLTNLSEVPWSSLGAGDSVKVYWRGSPYRELIALSTAGAEGNSIVITGVPNPQTGELPILDGENALQTKSLIYKATLEDQGVIVISNPTWGKIAANIVIENFHIRNGHQSKSFTNAAGVATRFDTFGCGIYIEGVRNFVLRNCTVTGCGNGIFINSKDGSIGTSSNILLEGNRIYGNGNPGRDREHNIYIEAVGAVYQYNYIGELMAGAQGAALKDRSSGTVVRYNHIEGGAHLLDLVETQGGAGVIDKHKDYKKTFVYGNTFVNGPSGMSRMIHYGGDQWFYQNYRRGTLYFYNNTVFIQANRTGDSARYRSILFQLPDQEENNGGLLEEKVECWNNVIHVVPFTPGEQPTIFCLVYSNGTVSLNLGVNWISPGFALYDPPYQKPFVGTITGEGKIIPTSGNDPGFAHWQSYDFSLTATSQCIDKGQAEVGGVVPGYGVSMEFDEKTGLATRPIVGSAIDLGAREWKSAAGVRDTWRRTAPAPRYSPASTLFVKMYDLQGRWVEPRNLDNLHGFAIRIQKGAVSQVVFSGTKLPQHR